MCGIVGVTLNSSGMIINDLLLPLKKLEYRGYDSVGFALSNGICEKDVGKIGDFIESVDNAPFHAGIGHSRWATHGGITRTNSHPHFNTDRSIFTVHNGIIENYDEMRNMLEMEGYKFVSNTDSEVIPHYFDYYLKHGSTVEDTIRSFFDDAEGTYAVLLMFKNDDRLYAFKNESPLVLGIAADRMVAASDIYSFSDLTVNAIFFDDKEYAIISPDNYSFFDGTGKPVRKHIIQVEREAEEVSAGHQHYMLKEIHEQPKVSARLINSIHTDQKDAIEKMAMMVDMADRVVFVSCGTSYHASLIGASVLRKRGYDVYNIVASEFDSFYKVDQHTFVIAISQSGETMDVVTVIKEARRKGASVGSIVNVPYSTIQRHSDVYINIVAGQEVAVASTKAFTNQVLALMGIANWLGAEVDMNMIPQNIAETIRINDSTAQQLAEEIKSNHHVFFLGRGILYAVAKEMALKLKEISYIHAEGMRAGELKHGTIALIDPKEHTPVISLIPDNNAHMLSSSTEVGTRGARCIHITNTEKGDFTIPSSNEVDFSLYAVVVGQLISYYTAVILGRNVDQPRNLAKSVTVH